MPSTAIRTVPAFVPEALAASQVGTWETDAAHLRIVSDATTARLFGIEVEAAAEGVPLATYAEAIHTADRRAFFEKIDRVREQGGLFVVEYRTCPAPGELHWILARGRYEHDPHSGNTCGRGIVIDITESKLDGRAEDRAFFIDPVEEETPLDRAALHAIEARRAIDAAGGREWPVLRQAVDTLLWAIGRALARRIDS